MLAIALAALLAGRAAAQCWDAKLGYNAVNRLLSAPKTERRPSLFYFGETEGPEACLAACASEKACAAFTWMGTEQGGWFKGGGAKWTNQCYGRDGSVMTMVPDKGRVSGAKVACDGDDEQRSLGSASAGGGIGRGGQQAGSGAAASAQRRQSGGDDDLMSLLGGGKKAAAGGAQAAPRGQGDADLMAALGVGAKKEPKPNDAAAQPQAAFGGAARQQQPLQQETQQRAAALGGATAAAGAQPAAADGAAGMAARQDIGARVRQSRMQQSRRTGDAPTMRKMETPTTKPTPAPTPAPTTAPTPAPTPLPAAQGPSLKQVRVDAASAAVGSAGGITREAAKLSASPPGPSMYGMD